MYGIPEQVSEKLADLHKAIEGLSNSLKIAKIDYDDAFRLGKRTTDKTRPIFIKLIRYRDRQDIFNSAKNLKGRNISIRNDTTKEMRIAEAALRRKKSEIQKSHPSAKISIRNQRLTVKDGTTTSNLQYDPVNDSYFNCDAEPMMQ
jgi:hypothetical protein